MAREYGGSFSGALFLNASMEELSNRGYMVHYQLNSTSLGFPSTMNPVTNRYSDVEFTVRVKYPFPYVIMIGVHMYGFSNTFFYVFVTCQHMHHVFILPSFSPETVCDPKTMKSMETETF